MNLIVANKTIQDSYVLFHKDMLAQKHKQE